MMGALPLSIAQCSPFNTWQTLFSSPLQCLYSVLQARALLLVAAAALAVVTLCSMSSVHGTVATLCSFDVLLLRSMRRRRAFVVLNRIMPLRPAARMTRRLIGRTSQATMVARRRRDRWMRRRCAFSSPLQCLYNVHTFPFLNIVPFLYFQRSAYNQYVVRSSS